MKRYYTEILKINFIDSINSRSDECEERLSEVKDKLKVQDHILRNTLKTAKEQGKLIPYLLDDAKTNLRLFGVRGKI